MERIATRRALAILAPTRTRATAYVRQIRPLQQFRANSSLPRVAEPGFWASLVPKPFRRSHGAGHAGRAKPTSKEWNPATFFIVIFLFIGSASINTIAVRNDNAAFVRRSDVRIAVLREVIEKLQRGEEVDVEQALGTGDPAREKEWEEMLREIENDRSVRESRKPEKTTKTPESTSAKAEATETLPTPTPSSTKPGRGGSAEFY